MVEQRWHTREDSGLRLDADGRFWHDDALVENANVARAFHRGLERAPDGRYLVRFGWDWAYVRVDDAPYQVLGVAIDSERVTLRLDDETEELLDPATLCASEEGVLYARVKSGSSEARLGRAAQGQLAQLIHPRDEKLHVRVGGRELEISPRQFVPVPPPDPK